MKKLIIGLALMFVSSLFISAYTVFRLMDGATWWVASDFIAGFLLLFAFFIALRWSMVGSLAGILVAVYPLTASLSRIFSEGYIFSEGTDPTYSRLLAFILLFIIGSLLVLTESRKKHKQG